MLNELASSEDELHLSWRHWLRLFNGFQVLPGMIMMTDQALKAGEGQPLQPASLSAAPTTADDAALAAGWSQVLGEAIEAVQPGLRALLRAGVPAPDVGHELADERGRVIAESELAWIEAKLVVLTVDQQEQATVWQSHHWTVVALPATASARSDASGDELAWVKAVVTKMNAGVAE